MEQLAVDLMVDIVETAMPVAVVFAFSNLVINTILRAAFGGRLWFGR